MNINKIFKKVSNYFVFKFIPVFIFLFFLVPSFFAITNIAQGFTCDNNLECNFTATCSLSVQQSGSSVDVIWGVSMDPRTTDYDLTQANVSFQKVEFGGTPINLGSNSSDGSAGGNSVITTTNMQPGTYTVTLNGSVTAYGQFSDSCTSSGSFTVSSAPATCQDPTATNYGQAAACIPGTCTSTIGSFTADDISPAYDTSTTLRFTLGSGSTCPWSLTTTGGVQPSPASGSGTSGTASTGNLSSAQTYRLSSGTAYREVTVYPDAPTTGGTCIDVNATNYGGALPCVYPTGGSSLCSPMTSSSAIRGCSNYVEWAPVYKATAAECVSYCQANGANACEYHVNGQCYVEFGDGCYVEGGFGGWNASTAVCPTPTPEYTAEGSLDAVTCDIIAGWAWDPNFPNTPVDVEIYTDGNYYTTYPLVSDARPDLPGNTLHNFTKSTPIGLKDGVSRSISAKAVDLNTGNKYSLWNSPKTLVCTSMTGALTTPSSCTIANGESSCDASISWTTTNPEATSAVTWTNGSTVSTNNGSATVTVSRTNTIQSQAFYLYNNAKLLDQKTIDANCISGTDWDDTTSTCKALVMTGSLTGPDSCDIANGASSCTATLAWGITNPEASPTAITASGMSNINISTSLSSPQSGTQSVTVPYDVRTFYLYNNAKSLAQKTVNANCISGTGWNDSTNRCETTVNPSCGSSHYSCSSGSSTSNAEDSQRYTWSCLSPNGGDPASCSESKIAASCGGSHYSCAVGTSTSNSSNASNYTWSCVSPNGGSTASCSEAKINASCSASHYGCSVGSMTGNTNGATAWTWSCVSPNGGSNASCSEDKDISVVTVTPPTVPTGGTVTITWTSGGGSCVGTNFDTGGASSGSITLTPNSSITYTLTCEDEVPASATVTVRKKPVIIEQ